MGEEKVVRKASTFEWDRCGVLRPDRTSGAWGAVVEKEWGTYIPRAGAIVQ